MSNNRIPHWITLHSHSPLLNDIHFHLIGHLHPISILSSCIYSRLHYSQSSPLSTFISFITVFIKNSSLAVVLSFSYFFTFKNPNPFLAKSLIHNLIWGKRVCTNPISRYHIGGAVGLYRGEQPSERHFRA